MQYLQHAYRIGEGDLPAEIEEIAREEMRHFRWLCETVVAWGGSPTDANLALEETAAGAPSEEGPFGGEGSDVGATHASPLPGAAKGPNVRVISQMNDDIRAEYATILRQLHLSFTTPDPQLS